MLAAAKDLEAQGHEVVHLEIGEPDFDTPQAIVQAGIEALQEGWHHYSPAAGIFDLRHSIAREVSKTRGIQVDPDEVVVTPGGKPIVFFSLLALIEPGDEVIYPNPGFPIYESMIRYVGATPVPVPLREELDFRLDVEHLLELAGPSTRMVILNSPSNPTGSVMTREDLQKLAEGFANSEVIFLSDEIYSRLIYEGEHHSIAAQPGMKERTILLDGFSKTYAMTGWRLGYGVMERSLAQQITKLMINSNSCTASFTQMAGIEALEGDQEPVNEMLRTFRKRRDRIVELLNQIDGISCQTPRGAFYVFPNITELGRSSIEMQNLLLQQAGVAALSGTSFGKLGEGYIRLSYANSMEQLEKGVERFGNLVSDLKTGV